MRELCTNCCNEVDHKNRRLPGRIRGRALSVLGNRLPGLPGAHCDNQHLNKIWGMREAHVFDEMGVYIIDSDFKLEPGQS
jgi:hypothetical protein